MTDLVLHTVLHGQKNYHFFRLTLLIKRMAEMQSRDTEYFGINIECVLYMMCMVGYVRNGDQFELTKTFLRSVMDNPMIKIIPFNLRIYCVSWITAIRVRLTMYMYIHKGGGCPLTTQ